MVVAGGIIKHPRVILTNRIFREVRRNPKSLEITLEDKLAKENN
jgi:hypothetical protein